MSLFQSIFITVKRFWYRYVIITLLLALIAGIWLEWREEQATAVSRVETDYNNLVPEESTWLNLSSIVFSESARPAAKYPDRQSLLPLHEAVKSTLDDMTSFYTPTGNIADSAKDYRDALHDVAGAINLYEPNNASMKRLLNALQAAANSGGVFKSDIDKYRTEAWRSFLSVII